MLRNRALAQLIEAHHQLDVSVRKDRQHFLSDWNVEHPFARDFLSPSLWKMRRQTRASGYIYFDEQLEVSESICAFHSAVEGLKLKQKNVVAGPGSTSLLTAFCVWLVQMDVQEVFYLPPLYYTLHYVLRSLNIRARPISGYQPFEPQFQLRLPEKKTVLLLTDPIWFAGARFSEACIRQIAEWLCRTGSLVFVDGSFQYAQWERKRLEFTSRFHPEQTFRVISPSKSLAIPEFRFAYLLMPKRFQEKFLFLYENTVGSASTADLMFARQSLSILRSETCNYALTDYLAAVYKSLLKRRAIRTEVTPECGYFVFAKVTKKLKTQIVMGGEYFEQKRYPEYVRLNLFKAQETLLNTC
jgi:aspartate/methionine/tyrosine aminotransferase